MSAWRRFRETAPGRRLRSGGRGGVIVGAEEALVERAAVDPDAGALPVSEAVVGPTDTGVTGDEAKPAQAPGGDKESGEEQGADGVIAESRHEVVAVEEEGGKGEPGRGPEGESGQRGVARNPAGEEQSDKRQRSACDEFFFRSRPEARRRRLGEPKCYWAENGD